MLDFLIEHSIQSKYVYKHIWNNNDVVMWDNRCTMHSVEPFDNNTIKRIMHRVTLIGDQKPIMAQKLKINNKFGRGGEIRTPDPLVPNQMRYQTALRPDMLLLI